MKIFSELTNQYYKTVAECEAAEQAFHESLKAERERKKELETKRQSRMKEVEEALCLVKKTQSDYMTLRNNFIKDYGSLPMVSSRSAENNYDFEDFFNILTFL